MNPLILKFKESPEQTPLDFSLIEYDSFQNLSVLRKTRQVAVEILNLGTETFTKADGEGSDQEDKGIRKILNMETRTFTKREDSDLNRDFQLLYALMATSTLTEAREATDSDR